MDILGALALLTLTLPITLAAGTAILLTDGRPILFRQQRLGQGGTAFTCLKYRTMVRDAERRRAELLHLNTTGGPAFKNAADPRVTRLGRHLRSWSVDELPQLVNVLRGEMSLVGPRPLPVDENRYQGTQWQRLSVKPGLTGLWQVSGRSSIPWDEWMALDLAYINGRSLWGDIVLLLRTPAAVLARRGAS